MKKKCIQDANLLCVSVGHNFQTIQSFTDQDQKELEYINKLLEALHGAFKTRFPQLAFFNFESLAECITQEISFDTRAEILKKIQAAYCQAKTQKDSRHLHYEQLYIWISRIQAKAAYSLFQTLVIEQLEFDQGALKKYQSAFLEIDNASQFATLVSQCSNLDSLHQLLKQSHLEEDSVQILKHQLEIDLKKSYTTRNKICDHACLIITADPKSYCNEIMKWCYLFYAKYQWRAQHIGLLWPNFLPQKLNHHFFNGRGHFYYAKMLIVGAEKRNIIPLQYSKRELVTQSFQQIWYYLNPWYCMLEQALTHLRLAEWHLYEKCTPTFIESIIQKIQSTPKYYDTNVGDLYHQLLETTVNRHYQKNPQLRTVSRPPPPTSHFDAHALGFSVIEMPAKHSRQATQHVTPSKQAIPIDHSDRLIELAEAYLTSTESWLPAFALKFQESAVESVYESANDQLMSESLFCAPLPHNI